MSADQVKNFKMLVFGALTRESNVILRDKLNEIASTIAKTNFPTHFEETVAYSAHVLKQAAEDLKSGAFSSSQMTLELLKTIREILSEICKRGLLPNEEYFRTNFLTHILPPLIELWTHFSEAIVLGISRAETATLKLMLELDSLLVYTLRCGTPDALNQIVELRECSRRLVLKSQAFLARYKSEQKVLAEQPEKQEVCEQLAVILTYELAFVMNQAPLVFGLFIEDYLSLNLGLALRNFEWDSILVRKACILALYRTLRLQIHFGDRGLHRARAPSDLQQVATAAFEAYGKVMSQSNLEALFEVLLSRTMVVEEEDREGRLELQIDDEEPDGLEQVTEELDCGIKKVCLSLIEQLCMNFPDRTFAIIHSLAERMVLGTLHVDDRRTQDSIISVIGILPEHYIRQDVPKEKRIDGIVLLKWMGEKGSELVFFSRRFPMLLRSWLNLIDYETARQVRPPHSVRARAAQTHSVTRHTHQVLLSHHAQEHRQSRERRHPAFRGNPRHRRARDSGHLRQDQQAGPDLAGRLHLDEHRGESEPRRRDHRPLLRPALQAQPGQDPGEQRPAHQERARGHVQNHDRVCALRHGAARSLRNGPPVPRAHAAEDRLLRVRRAGALAHSHQRSPDRAAGGAGHRAPLQAAEPVRAELQEVPAGRGPAGVPGQNRGGESAGEPRENNLRVASA